MPEPTKPGLIGNANNPPATGSVPPAGQEKTSIPENVTKPGDKKIQAIKDATKTESDKLNAKVSLPNFVDITQIQDIYSAMRDGDHWTAFSRAIAFLNAFVNPAKPAGGLRTTARVMNETDAKEFERSCDLLDGVLDGAEDRVEDSSAKVTPNPRVGRSANAATQNVDISFTDVLTVLNMVRNILQQFRKNRQ